MRAIVRGTESAPATRGELAASAPCSELPAVPDEPGDADAAAALAVGRLAGRREGAGSGDVDGAGRDGSSGGLQPVATMHVATKAAVAVARKSLQGLVEEKRPR
jgi:hypothetical protein